LFDAVGLSVLVFGLIATSQGARAGSTPPGDCDGSATLPTPSSVRGITLIGTVVGVERDVPYPTLRTYRVEVEDVYAGKPRSSYDVVLGWCNSARLEVGARYLISRDPTSERPDGRSLVIWRVRGYTVELVGIEAEGRYYQAPFPNAKTLRQALDIVAPGALPPTDTSITKVSEGYPLPILGLAFVIALAVATLRVRATR
jgi:hypothetical protein